MKTYSKILFLITVLWTTTSWSQNNLERKIITNSYDKEKSDELIRRLRIDYELRQARISRYAEKYNIPLKIYSDGLLTGVLFDITDNLIPIYNVSHNEGAAITSETSKLYPNGELGLNLTGKGMNLGIWEIGGTPLETHELFQGRVQSLDPEYTWHATFVAGTAIGGAGIHDGARGMAYEATARCYDAFADLSEMAVEAANGLLVSNHSYGSVIFSGASEQNGKYSGVSLALDEITYTYPYFLPVFSAGNDRSKNISPTGYDLLNFYACSKNNIVVAAVKQVDDYNNTNDVVMSDFSSWGPTDDGRIRPDISAKGVSLFSSFSNNKDDSYTTASGTSYAAPAVSGTLLLLQEHYHNTSNEYMKSATLKGLICHTAKEAGRNDGPDYEFGWGLLDAAAAANAISGNEKVSLIKELTLKEGETYTLELNIKGMVEELMASITWTDPPGNATPFQGFENDRRPKLMNDLDIRITRNGETFYPWKLDPENPAKGASRGDNIVDNIEKVEISNPSDKYLLTVSHKGNLLNGKQDFSLIVTGLAAYDCEGTVNGQAYLDSCGMCVGGNTGILPCKMDCNGDYGGSAFIDSCNVCVSGLTGKNPCVQDCNDDYGGTAYIDSCDVCAGGNTAFEPILNPLKCGVDISVFPNPTSRFINVCFSSGFTPPIEVLLSASDGKLIESFVYTGQDDFSLDLANRAAGVYWLKLKTADAFFVRRILLNP